MARTPADIISDVRRNLRILGSPQATFPDYGNTWALVRSLAGVILEQEDKLIRAMDSIGINSATGAGLTQRAAELGVNRIEGQAARGAALMRLTSGTAQYAADTLLTTTSRQLVYRLVSSTQLSAIERAAEIQAVGVGSVYNLPAGTTLIMPSDGAVVAEVGVSREAGTGLALGGLTNGRDIEDDESLRSRLLRFINGTNAEQLESLLYEAVPDAGRLYIAEHTPITGYVTIYAETQNEDILARLRSAVDFYKPPGLSYIVRALTPQYVNLSVWARAAESALEEVSAAIRVQTQYYFDSLGPSSQFEPGALSQQLFQNVPGLRGLEVRQPAGLISTNSGSVLELGTLNLQLESLS